MWIHGVGVFLSLPAASYALLSDLTKRVFFAIRDGSRIFVICLVHTSGQLFLYHTPGQRPPHVTGLCLNTVGARDERTFYVHIS